MRPPWTLVAAAAIAVAALHLSGGAPAATPRGVGNDPNDPKLIGYGIGFYLGQEVRDGLETDGVEVDRELIVKGFTDGLVAADPQFDEEQLDEVLAAVHERMQQRMVERLLAEDEDFRKLHDDNLARSLAYLEKNALEEGVVTRESGLQYKVIVAGTGPVPGPNDTVIVNFVGRLVDGPEFARGEGVELEVREMLPGSREIMSIMPVGSTWHVVMPPDLTYGAGGGPPNIGPNEALVIEVELLGIK